MKDIYLIVTIDTEEDNWGQAREGITLENIKLIPKCQRMLDSFGIKPVYLCDFPVVKDPTSVRILREIVDQGKCEIGTHLHPWNTPPMLEELGEENSHLKNLPKELIKSKLNNLTEQIRESFGIRPIIFRAGRWGLGKNVIKALCEFGYKIDTSVTPFTNWESYGKGQNFSSYPFKPYFMHPNHDINKPAVMLDGNILEIPASIGFNRTPFFEWFKVYIALNKKPFNKFKAIGIAHRAKLLQKLWLSPEYSNVNEMLSLSRLLLNSGVNLLNLTFHSPSLKPGLSPFVKTEKDLEYFWSNIQRFLEKSNLIGNIISVTPSEILSLIREKKIKYLSADPV